jgi:hypothetical protein
MTVYWVSAGVAAFLWTASLLTPALATCDQSGNITRWWGGIEILGQGWMGLPIAMIGWYANIPFWIALVYLAFGRIYLGLGIFAALLATSSLGRVHLFDGVACQRGPGFWLWMSAFGVLLVGEAWGRLVRNEPPPRPVG